jgi:hypothetical protein
MLYFQACNVCTGMISTQIAGLINDGAYPEHNHWQDSQWRQRANSTPICLGNKLQELAVESHTGSLNKNTSTARCC